MSKYSSGLQNAGSYLVSGRPFVARRSVNAGGEVKIEFPYVTKNITIRIPSPPNTARLMITKAGSGGHIFLSNVPGATPTFSLGGSGNDFAFSFWMRSNAGGTGNKIMQFGSGSTATNTISLEKVTGPALAMYGNVFGAYPGLTNTVANPLDEDWHHVLMTQKTSSVALYLDGQTVASSVHSGDMNIVNFIRFGWNGGGTNDQMEWDETCVFATGFTKAEVSELYNSGEWFNPRSHSQSEHLQAWWTMGDDHRDRPTPMGAELYSESQPIPIVHDVINADDDMQLSAFHHAGDEVSGALGPFTTQTTGKLRVHLLSTTSSPHGANVFGNKHYRELQGYNTSITLPLKSKEIYLSGIGAQVTFEVIAELSNIPASRMYALTGSGIDE